MSLKQELLKKIAELESQIYMLPDDPQTKLFLNDWGRRTYKTTECNRLMRQNEGAVLFTHSHGSAKDSQASAIKLTNEYYNWFVLTTKYSIVHNEDTNEHVLRSSCEDHLIKNRTFIVDNVELIFEESHTIKKFIADLTEHGAKEIHLYGKIPDEVLAEYVREENVYINHRPAPTDTRLLEECVTKSQLED